MLRYRIAPDPAGHYVVIAASSWAIPVSETYSTRAEAQDTADWLNRLRDNKWQDEPKDFCVLPLQSTSGATQAV